MTSMSNDQAKLRLAMVACDRFTLEDDVPWTVKELFSPTEKDDPNDKVLGKVANSKTWQRSLLERLIGFELIEKVAINNGHGVAYKGLDKDTITKLLEEERNEEGRTFRWLLFPRDYRSSEAFRTFFFPEEEPLPDESIPQANEEVVMSPVQEVLVQLLSVTTEMQEQFVEVRKEQKLQSEAFVDLGNALQSHHKAMAEVTAKLLQLVNSDNHMLTSTCLRIKDTEQGVLRLEKSISRLEIKVSLRERLSQIEGRLSFWGRNNEKLAAGLREAVNQEKEMAAGLMLVSELAEKLDGNESEETEQPDG